MNGLSLFMFDRGLCKARLIKNNHAVRTLIFSRAFKFLCKCCISFPLHEKLDVFIIMDRKKRAWTGPANESKKAKKSNITFTRESFSRDIRSLQIYTENDPYFRDAKITTGPLKLNWR